MNTADSTAQAVMQSPEPTVQDTTATSISNVESIDPTTGNKVIAVHNPTAEEMQSILQSIKVNYDFNVTTKPVNFNFKKSTDKITNIETVRKPVQLAIPYPSMEGIIAILEGGGKGLELLVEAIETVVNSASRDLLAEDITLTAATFPVDKVSWEFIANLPKAQRKGGGIPKETWDGFAQDYVEVMPTITGKTVDQVANAAKILVAKLTQVRTNEPVLQLLTEQLAVYAEHSPNIEEYQDCVAFLLNKAETFLNVSEEELLANL
jgi:hypothetical protein